MNKQYDAIILGSGQAGNPLAQRLAKEGWKVALVEREHYGGTCVNVGCTPTKTMVHRAQIAYYAKNAARWGVKADNVSVDLKVVKAQKDKIVTEWRASVCRELEGVDLYDGEASFIDAHSVKVGDKVLTASKFFINTGGYPIIPGTPGLAGTPYLTNETILDLEEIPESLVVIGGGYVGLEFGQMFARFGSKVTVIQREPQIVPHEDEDVAEALTEALRGEGLTFLLNAEVESVEYSEGFTLKIPGFDPVHATHVLVATGRAPNTKALNLAAAGIETDIHGAIKVNDRLETDVDGIWALGDVKGGPAFTHISYNDFQIVEANLLDGQNRSIKDRIVPYCVFTDPQLGAFGITEKEARRRGKPIKIGAFPMSSVARAIERDETAGLMKMVIDAVTDQILGATILGVEGGEVLQILYALAMAKQPYTLLKEFVFIHPTLAEGLFGLTASVKLAS